MKRRKRRVASDEMDDKTKKMVASRLVKLAKTMLAEETTTEEDQKGNTVVKALKLKFQKPSSVKKGLGGTWGKRVKQVFPGIQNMTVVEFLNDMNNKIE